MSPTSAKAAAAAHPAAGRGNLRSVAGPDGSRPMFQRSWRRHGTDRRRARSPPKCLPTGSRRSDARCCRRGDLHLAHRMRCRRAAVPGDGGRCASGTGGRGCCRRTARRCRRRDRLTCSTRCRGAGPRKSRSRPFARPGRRRHFRSLCRRLPDLRVFLVSIRRSVDLRPVGASRGISDDDRRPGRPVRGPGQRVGHGGLLEAFERSGNQVDCSGAPTRHRLPPCAKEDRLPGGGSPAPSAYFCMPSAFRALSPATAGSLVGRSRQSRLRYCSKVPRRSSCGRVVAPWRRRWRASCFDD
jgi:hypothetical protein